MAEALLLHSVHSKGPSQPLADWVSIDAGGRPVQRARVWRDPAV